MIRTGGSLSEDTREIIKKYATDANLNIASPVKGQSAQDALNSSQQLQQTYVSIDINDNAQLE